MAVVASPLTQDLASEVNPTPAGAEDALTALVRLVRSDLEACNRVIVERMDSPVALIPQLAAHLVAVPGVVEHGLFLDLATEAFVAGPDGVETLRR